MRASEAFDESKPLPRAVLEAVEVYDRAARYREGLQRIAYPDGDEAAFYDWSVAEKIAREALEHDGRA